MSNGHSGRLTKNERREQAREEARRAREAARRKERTNKFLLQGGIIVAVLLVVGLVGWAIWSNTGPKGPGPQNMASGGVTFVSDGSGGMRVATTVGLPDEAERIPTETNAEIQIQAFVDFLCPICQRFELGITSAEFQASGFPGTANDFVGNSAYIKTLVEQGVASFEVVPVAILDRASLGTRYATRAANAFACVADNEPQIAYDYLGAPFANQPAEGTSGLDDNELISIARGVGSNSGDTEMCIRNQTFKNFITDNTNTASSKAEFPNLVNDDGYTGGIGTPRVYVNGEQFTPQYDWSHTASLRTFIQERQGEEYQESQTATPTPTPTPTPAP